MESLAIRGSDGLSLASNLPESDSPDPSFPNQSVGNVKAMVWSHDGSRISWADGTGVFISEYGEEWSPPKKLDHPRASRLSFSSLGNYLSTFETYAVRKGETNNDNVRIWKDSAQVLSYVHKGPEHWNLRWSDGEKLGVRRIRDDKFVSYEDGNFSSGAEISSESKFHSFSLSPVGRNIVLFFKGKSSSGSPASFAKFYAFPNFKNPLGTRSLSFVEKMDTFWNVAGNSVLILAHHEVDNSSYYGKQQLHYMNSKGESMGVPLDKSGPIYHAAWLPSNEFSVVYGFTPAKVAIFNNAGDKVFDLGSGPRNVVHFNPQGTLLLLGGFGNINGKIEVWDYSKNKKIVSFEAPYTTNLQWSPDGKKFVTSTCSPRLRTGNGFKIWHYTGSLLYEKELLPKEELWEVAWRNPAEPLPAFEISYKPVEGIKVVVSEASKEAYRPPNARNRGAPRLVTSLDNLDVQEHTKKPLNRAAMRNIQRRKAKRKNVDGEQDANGEHDANGIEETNKVEEASHKVDDSKKPNQSKNEKSENEDLKKLKQLRKLQDKLKKIKKLKECQEMGQKLELNQIASMGKENEILEEIAKLKL